MEENTRHLKNDDGEEKEFEIVVSFDIGDKTYVLLAGEGEEAVYPFAIETDEDGEDMLVAVEDEDEFKLIEEAYDALADDDDGQGCCCGSDDHDCSCTGSESCDQ